MLKDQHDSLPASLDLSVLSVSQLALLQEELDKQRASAQERERQAVKSRVVEVLESAGYSVADLHNLFPGSGRQTSQARAAYRHPTKRHVFWTGKGRKPQWLIEYVSVEGQTLDDLRVK